MKNKTVGRNFIEAHVLVVSLVLLITSVFTTIILFFNSRYELSQYVKNTTEILSISAIPAVVFDDQKEASIVLSSLSTDEDFISGTIYKKGKVLASYRKDKGADNPDYTLESKWQVLHYNMDLLDDGEIVGTLSIAIGMNRVYSTTFNNLLAIIAASAIALIFGTLFAKKAASRFTLPINQVLRVMRKFTNTHNYGIYLPESVEHPPIEISALYEQFKEMIREIRKRDNDLLKANQNLEEKVKERTRELEAAQQRMLEDAHKAGIADVATGVLHNIGNVLNTVSTSSSQIYEKLEKSSLLPKLKNLGTIFDKEEDELIQYLKEDDRSKTIRGYFEVLTKAFDDEFSDMSQLNLSIKNSSRIIAEIIHDQQSLASNNFAIERIDLKETLDRAIEIKKTYLDRSFAELQVESHDLPIVLGHRARLFQVFINLIANSCQAFPEDQKTRTIRINHSQDKEFLYLEFHDNGPGISQKGASKLFSYGYTTKPTGHGFGLHSCKTYMRDLNGDIYYKDSESLGGACFVVKVPIR